MRLVDCSRGSVIKVLHVAICCHNRLVVDDNDASSAEVLGLYTTVGDLRRQQRE